MSEIYNAEYYKQYDVGIGKVDYSDSEYTKGFLSKIAQKIVDDLHPKTVLDAGCAMGHLVAALRDLGVEAYGVDISEYAVSQARADIRKFCKTGSLADELPAGLPKHYDLVVSIEVLEHLYEENGKKAIQNLCKLSDQVLFSSTPDDFAERTHVNVQQREYWCRIFFENGFVDDINYRPKYLTAHAVLFRKNEDMTRQIEDYERNIRLSEYEFQQMECRWSKAVEDKERHIQNIEAAREAEKTACANKEETLQRENERMETELHCAEKQYQSQLAEQQQAAQQEKQALKADISSVQKKLDESLLEREKQNETVNELQKELSHYKEHYFAAINQREELKAQLANYQNAYHVISNAFFWKITKPLRVCLDTLKRIFGRVAFLRLLDKGVRCLHEHGWSYTRKKVQNWKRHRQDYTSIANRPLFTEAQLEAQKREKFPKQIKFSIVVPLFNTPEKFLREMIQSVMDQTYADWELCMADGSDSAHRDVERICQQYARRDHRIKYQKLEKNLGISGNTNACLDMAQGDYIALFDHDDLLHPAALHEVMRAICEQDADFIYTDENTFHETPADAFCPHFKPDYAPDTLRANNYICHLTVFRRTLLKESGRFRPACDGSQDYDMVLRLTENARKIVHIPEILYYWRAHANSVAESVGAKPYVIEAAHRAIEDHLRRIGLQGEVLDTVVPSMYRIRYKVEGEPLVSIIIPNKDHSETLKTCIDSILKQSSYHHYEIIVVENNSVEEKTFEYYRYLENQEKIRIVTWKGKFNYSAINNFGIKYAHGEYILLLNNDTEVISSDWLQEMLMFAQREDVGAVGAKLYYPDNTVQHAGLGIGLLTLAGHLHRGFDRNHPGYMGRLIYAQDLSGVTAACMMIRRDVWEKVHGLDESFEVAFNDVDLCMRIRKAGYLIVWTPYAELYHYESKSRGYEDTPEKQKRFEGEVRRFQERWKKELEAGDPYYNPNLTLDREDFSVK